MTAADRQWRAGRRSPWTWSLGTAALSCGLLAAAAAGAEPAGQAPGPPPVEILRGSAAPPPAPVEPAAGSERRRAIGGERLWLVDEAGGRLVGCRLINTIRVGGQAIRCTERPLPEGRPVRD